jgi:Fur family ferric uptake transcriptional regulator
MKKLPVEKLSQYLTTQGLRSTRQRDAILKTFIEAGQHVSAEELYARVKKAHPGIGYATVYRTLKLLAEAGLVEERRFQDGFTRFEHRNGDGHHDHMICTRCSAIIEFENERIEALQYDVARQKGFKVLSHKLELYGLCESCQLKKGGQRGGARSHK